MLVGSKLDEIKKRRISMQDAVDFSERNECLAYYETSAKDAINIDEVFFTIALAAFQQMKET